MKELYLEWKATLYESTYNIDPSANLNDDKFLKKYLIFWYFLPWLEQTHVLTIVSREQLNTFQGIVGEQLLDQGVGMIARYRARRHAFINLSNLNLRHLLKTLQAQKLIKVVSQKIEVIIRLDEQKKSGESTKLTLNLAFDNKKDQEIFLYQLGKTENLQFSPYQQKELAEYKVEKKEIGQSTTHRGTFHNNQGKIIEIRYKYHVLIPAIKIDKIVNILLPTKSILLALQQFFTGCLPLDTEEKPNSSLFWLSVSSRYVNILLAKEKEQLKFFATNCPVKNAPPLSASSLFTLFPIAIPQPLLEIICEYNAHDCRSADEICHPSPPPHEQPTKQRTRTCLTM
jgi:hypothetical protein